MKESVKDNLGKCYELSWQYMSRNGYSISDLVLVHGYITDYQTGRVIDHAWTETKNDVYDTVLESTFPKRVYYSMYHAEVAFKYDYEQAMDKATETGVYGPWHRIPSNKVKWWKEEKNMRKEKEILEVTQETKINEEFILEVGDRIQIVENSNWEQKLKDFDTMDYQHRNGNSIRTGIPDTIQYWKNESKQKIELTFSFKNTSEKEAMNWVKRNAVYILPSEIKYEMDSAQDGDYQDDWVSVYFNVFCE